MSAAKLKFWSSTSVVVGCVIGAGVFVKPGRVLVLSGNSTVAMFAWIIGGLITLAGGLTVAEIAFRLPRTGGAYVFIEEIYGKKIGFISGWMQSLIYAPGIFAVLAMFFASLFCTFFRISMDLQIYVALAVLLLLTFVNILGTKYASFVQNSTVMIKMFPLILIAIAGLIYGEEPVWGIDLPGNEISLAAGLGGALLSSLFAYDGWLGVASIAGEIDNPSKNLPRSIITGLSIVMFAYVIINYSIFHILGKEHIAQLGENAGSAAAISLFGPIGGKILSLCIMLSIFGGLNGQILTLSRIPYAMAREGVFPLGKFFAKLHPTFATPVNSILLTVGVAILIMLTLPTDRVSDFSIFSMYAFYGLICAGIFSIRKKFGVPGEGNYKVPLYPAVPVFAVGGILFICYGMLMQAPFDAFVSLAITLAGFPVYIVLTYLDPTKK